MDQRIQVSNVQYEFTNTIFYNFKMSLRNCKQMAISNDENFIALAFLLFDIHLVRFRNTLIICQLNKHQIIQHQQLKDTDSNKKIIACLFTKNSKNLIFGWENGELYIWSLNPDNSWECYQMIEINQLFEGFIDQILFNQQESVLITSGSKLVFYQIQIHDNKIQYQAYDQLNLNLQYINISEQGNLLIGEASHHSCLMIIMQTYSKKWQLAKKIKIEIDLNFSKTNKLYFLRDNLILYNKHLLYYDSWNNKLIFRRTKEISFRQISYNKVLKSVFYVNQTDIMIYQVEGFQLILQQQLQFAQKQNKFFQGGYSINQNGNLLIYCNCKRFQMWVNSRNKNA